MWLPALSGQPQASLQDLTPLNSVRDLGVQLTERETFDSALMRKKEQQKYQCKT